LHYKNYPSPISLSLCLPPEDGASMLRYLIHSFIGKDMIYVEERDKFVPENSFLAAAHAKWRKQASSDSYSRDWVIAQTKDLKGKEAIDLSEYLSDCGEGKQINRFLLPRDRTTQSPVNQRGERLDVGLYDIDIGVLWEELAKEAP